MIDRRYVLSLRRAEKGRSLIAFVASITKISLTMVTTWENISLLLDFMSFSSCTMSVIVTALASV